MATNNTPNEPVTPKEAPLTEQKHIDFVRDTQPPPPPNNNNTGQTGTTKEKL